MNNSNSLEMRNDKVCNYALKCQGGFNSRQRMFMDSTLNITLAKQKSYNGNEKKTIFSTFVFMVQEKYIVTSHKTQTQIIKRELKM